MTGFLTRPVSACLPDFPWDTIADVKALAAVHPDGLVDLSVGTPVDPVPEVIRRALASVAEVPGYPTTQGTRQLRQAAAEALGRRFGISGVDSAAVLPVIGTKEVIAGLPRLLGLGSGDVVVIPEVAYPTYEVGARLAGAEVLRADGTLQIGPRKPALIFVNSPANPTGQVLGLAHLRKVVEFARNCGAVVASDECYLGLDWSDSAVSILDPRVCDGDHTGLLAIHSLSKTSNLASYRAGFLAGDPELVSELLAIRKHTGLMVPYPIQAAMTAALTDDTHLAQQRARYARRREILHSALLEAGFRIDHSEAGLYLWTTRNEPAPTTLIWLAERGILAAPGTFYGRTAPNHVRLALTAPDDRISAAVSRLTS